jgi:hypothetical protein
LAEACDIAVNSLESPNDYHWPLELIYWNEQGCVDYFDVEASDLTFISNKNTEMTVFACYIYMGR